VEVLYPVRWWTQPNFICCCWPCLYKPPSYIRTSLLRWFRDKQEVLKLKVGSLHPHIIYWVTSCLQLLALSILMCSQNMSFLARLVTDICRSLDKFELGGTVPQPLLKNFLHRVRVLVHSYLPVRCDLPSFINFRDINDVQKLVPRTFIRGHPRGSKVVPLDSTGIISC